MMHALHELLQYVGTHLATIIEWVATASILYFFTVNSVYMILLILAFYSLSRYAKVKKVMELMVDQKGSFAPSISILAPAYNEQETITESVRSFLMLNYPSFEVIVINDGSKDDTLQRLKDTFKLEPTDILYDGRLSSTHVRGAYRSPWHPNLLVIDKDNGGKADALNVGIGFSQYEIFCTVDSDSILESDALLKIAAPFMESPSEVVASGGTVRIANGTRIKHGRVEQVHLPKSPLVLMQVIEYTRAFLCGRIGWNALNSTLVISGAFGLFSRSAVLDAGGYTHDCIGEDMELIIRLHSHCRSIGRKYSIIFVPDPVCWTEAPADLVSLGKQRDRWQRGLADTIRRHWNLVFNVKHGAVGFLALPYFLFVELLGPVFEVLSLLVIGLSFIFGGFDGYLLWIFFCASILYGAVLSLSAILIEEIYFSKYNRPRQLMILMWYCLVESFWFRQLSTYWRLRGLVKYFKGDRAWGHLRRVGF